MLTKPFAPASEKNKAPILAILREVFSEPGTVLEIGSGSGQHAVHFAAALSHLAWQPSELEVNLSGIELWLAEAALANIKPPLILDVTAEPWPLTASEFDGVFSANTAHIMSWPMVEAMFAGVGQVLRPGGHFCLYGPFSYSGRHTSDSNEQFDYMLRVRDPDSGIRDFADLEQLASTAGLVFVEDHPMPANNRTLVWSKS